MSDDDRFADLGRKRDEPKSGTAPSSTSGGRASRSAGERLAELDEASAHAPAGLDRRSLSRRYTWVLGVLVALVIILVGVETLPHAGQGFHGPPPGRPIPRFAAPLATGSLDGTPNVKQGPHDTIHTNKTPACDVRGTSVVNSCELVERPLVLTFVGPGTTGCNRFLDRIQRLQPQFPQTAFAAVVSGHSRADVARLVRRHRWTFPVAVDSNHVLFDLYDVAVCATTVFVYRGGIVRTDRILAQNLTDAQLRAAIRATVAGPPGTRA